MNSKTQAIEFAITEVSADNNHELLYDSDIYGNFVRCKLPDGLTSSKYYYTE